MGTISKNFSYSEFERSETAEKRGIVNVIATARVRDSIEALVINVLQPLRTALGVEMPRHRNPDTAAHGPQGRGAGTALRPDGPLSYVRALQP